jgi:hypothetical protein
MEITRSFVSSRYRVSNLFVQWNTSAIPDDAEIKEARFDLGVTNVANSNGYSVTGDWYVSPSCCGSSDYTSAPITGAVDMQMSDIVSGAGTTTNMVRLLDPATHISKTGTSGVRVSLSGGTPTGTNTISIDASVVPRLTVEYETPETQAVRQTFGPDEDDRGGGDGYSNIRDAAGDGEVSGAPDPSASQDFVADEPAGFADEGTGGGYTIQSLYRCPEVKGDHRISDNTYIRYFLYDNRGCVIPLRTGNSDYGFIHQLRKKDSDLQRVGENHHDVNDYARARWQAAIGNAAPAIVKNDHRYLYFSAQYDSPGGEHRTMCVLVHFTTVRSGYQATYNRKGIITAWWGRGLGYSEDCKRLDRNDAYVF